jgi:hypothetical protein
MNIRVRLHPLFTIRFNLQAITCYKMFKETEAGKRAADKSVPVPTSNRSHSLSHKQVKRWKVIL